MFKSLFARRKAMLSDASQRWKPAGFRRVEKPQGFSTTSWFARSQKAWGKSNAALQS